jgi:hypothetical protein
MKRLVLSALWCFLHGGMWAQTHLQVILVTNRPVGRVEASDIDQDERLSVPYTDTARFDFNKRYGTCYAITFSETGKSYTRQLWLDAANDTVYAHIEADELVIDSVRGSPLYEAVLRFDKTYGTLCTGGDTAALNRFMLDAYAANIDNLFSCYIGRSYLRDNANAPGDLSRLQSLAVRQERYFARSPYYAVLLRTLDIRLRIHRLPLRDFTFIDKRGKAVTLHLEGADTYVLDFWNLQSDSSVEDHKDIKPALSQLAARRIAVIGVIHRDDVDTWRAYLSENGYDWPNYMEGGGGGLSAYMSLQAFPTYVVVDKDGDIKGVYGAFRDVMKGLGF